MVMVAGVSRLTVLAHSRPAGLTLVVGLASRLLVFWEAGIHCCHGDHASHLLTVQLCLLLAVRQAAYRSSPLDGKSSLERGWTATSAMPGKQLAQQMRDARMLQQVCGPGGRDGWCSMVDAGWGKGRVYDRNRLMRLPCV